VAVRAHRRLPTSLSRLAVTGAFVATTATLVVWNAPAGTPLDVLKPAASRLVLTVGLDQDWRVFAPGPRPYSVGVFARVTRPDGSVGVWRPPDGDPVVGPYRTYRWQKMVERLRGDDHAFLWEDAARFIADEVGGPVERVELVRTWRFVTPPGAEEPRQRVRSYVFYELEL
jgi:hypothetical protein